MPIRAVMFDIGGVLEVIPEGDNGIPIFWLFLCFCGVLCALTGLSGCAILFAVVESWLGENQVRFRSTTTNLRPWCWRGREFAGHVKRLWRGERWPES